MQTPAMPPPRVKVSPPVEKEVADYVEFSGQTAAVKTVEVRARVWGYLESVNFKEGALVKKGDVLFQIDPRPYKALVDQAKAKIKQDEAQLAHNKATFQRIEQLRAKGAASQEEYDKSLADRAAMEATLLADKADLETKKLDLDFTRIEAPISGRISRFEVTEGNVVQSGQNGGTLLTTIVSVDPIYLYFEVDERTMLQTRRMIQEGAMKSAQETSVPVFVGLVDEEGFPHEGVINFLDNRVDPSTGTLRVRGVLANPDGLLSPGLFVRVHLPLGSPRRSLLVPEQALGSDQGQKFLYVVNDANEVNYRPVKVGRLYDGLRVIEQGLAKGERVVVNGLQRVRPGAKVDPRPPEAPVPGAPGKSAPAARLANNGSTGKPPAGN